jgi:hypothetical protein
MPPTYREVKKDGKPRFEVMTGFDYKTGAPYWFGVGLRTAQGLMENERAFKEWVSKNTRGKG